MFEQKLKGLRDIAGMSQQQVADLLGVDRSTYTGYETSKSLPSVDKVKKIASIFNATIDSLLDDTSPVEKKPNRNASIKVAESTAPYNDKKPLVDMSLANLTSEEKMLICQFRLISESDRQAVILDVNEKYVKTPL